MEDSKQEIHLVVIATGAWDDYKETVLFATKDKDKATKWVEKFHSLIDRHVDRIENYPTKKTRFALPFWYEFIKYQVPSAIVVTTEIR